MNSKGFGLIELLVATAIGIFLIGGAVTLYVKSRSTYGTQETVARLQEQARFALATLQPDIELAGLYGFNNQAQALRLVQGGEAHQTLAVAHRMRQVALHAGEPAPEPVSGLPASAHACGDNFAVDVLRPVQGSNGAFALGPRPRACNPYNSRAQRGADTLTLRHASSTSSLAMPGRIQILSSRLGGSAAQVLFADGLAPGAVNPDRRVHDLVVRSYYVARDSVQRSGFPSLRVKSLTSTAGAPAFVDSEIMPGVEDLQVQFGIDTGDHDDDGTVDAAADADKDGLPDIATQATRYVNPDFAGLHRFSVVAVRVWIRVRAEQAEPGFVDTGNYRYADVSFTPAGDERAIRRVLMSRTIALRNARSF